MIVFFMGLLNGILVFIILRKYKDSVTDFLFFALMICLAVIVGVLSIPERVVLLFVSDKKLKRRLEYQHNRLWSLEKDDKKVMAIRKKIHKLEFLLERRNLKKQKKNVEVSK